jgi:guanylate kinase
MPSPKNDIKIVISAPSGAGKTTIISRFMEENEGFVFAVSTTTRKKRTGEADGKSYYFTGVDEFRKMIDGGEFLEWAMVHQNYYGTTQKEVDRIEATGKIPIFDVDVQGAKNLCRKLENGVFIYIVPPSIESLRERLRLRGQNTESEIEVRVNNAVRELKEFAVYNYIIINEDLDDAVRDLVSIIRAEKCRTPRNSSKIIVILEGVKDVTA